jgi:glutaredoxin
MHLTLYSKPDCHLCDDMKAVVKRVLATREQITLEEIDISTDSELLDRHGLEIPVLMIDGRKVAKFRITEGELTRILDG